MRHDSPCYQYYQWRKFAFENGDSASAWRGEPLVFGGVTWYPPPAIEPFYLRQSRRVAFDRCDPPTSGAAADSGRRRQRCDRRSACAGNERRQLESLLNELSPERSTIGVVMVFAMDHADKASEVVQIISERLTSAATPIAAKIVYLFVISDILHNCGNADIPEGGALPHRL
jgi:U2-associated protein SR140